jgi:toxin ParE1/3/4
MPPAIPLSALLMPSLIYRPEARLDLKLVYGRISQNNPGAAANFVRSIDQKARLLAESPRMGRTRPELGPNLRSFPVGDYLIIYEESTADTIEVVRVLHGSRDLETIFRDS